jgi:hypothetical protein
VTTVTVAPTVTVRRGAASPEDLAALVAVLTRSRDAADGVGSALATWRGQRVAARARTRRRHRG